MKTFPLHQSEYPEAWSYELLEGKALKGVAGHSCILNFEGIAPDQIVYNPCPFVIDGELRLLGRVEAHASEIAHVHQFTKNDKAWQSRELVFLHVQDPFLSCIGDRIIAGGVSLDFSEPFPGTYTIENYRTSFYDFETKKKIIDGSDGMKDIRLVDLGDKIGVFTRPRREEVGTVHSSIQFGTVPTISDINAEVIDAISFDPLKKVKGFFNHNEWGGVNAVYQLHDGWLGVLGHIAYYDQHMRKYAAMAFEFNPNTGEVTHPVIILSRDNLAADAKAKREDLHNVIFPGGLIFTESDEVLFFYGLGDAHVGVSLLPYPFHHELDRSVPNNHLFMMDRSTALAAVDMS